MEMNDSRVPDFGTLNLSAVRKRRRLHARHKPLFAGPFSTRQFPIFASSFPLLSPRFRVIFRTMPAVPDGSGYQDPAWHVLYEGQ